MFPKINPTTTSAWQALQAHYKENKDVKMKDLFAADAERFNKYHIRFDDIVFDYSKNIFSEKTLELLLQLAADCKVADAIAAMFSGEKINLTEGRAVLHTALRNFSGKPVILDGKDVMEDVQAVLKQMKEFCAKNTVANGKATQVKK